MKAEIEAVRTIIKNADSKMLERIKWNAPSYYYKEDLVTFNPRATKHVHLVFHHAAIVKIKSAYYKVIIKIGEWLISLIWRMYNLKREN